MSGRTSHHIREQSYNLLIDVELYEYIMTLARESAPNEVLGMGMISMQECGHCTDFLLEEVFIPNQFVAPGYCAFKEGSQNEIIEEVLERGDSPEGLCFRWHSHADGDVYFSSIDEDDIVNCDSPYVVNLVVNAKQEMIARLDILEPVPVRNIPVNVLVTPSLDEELIKECNAEIMQCCKPIAQFKTKGDTSSTKDLLDLL